MKNWRNSKEYRIWRIKVIRRDKKCIICGAIKNREAHHLNHSSYFKEERFDVDNGVCLCHNHHSLFHNVFIGGTRKKCTKKDFIRYKKLINKVCK